MSRGFVGADELMTEGKPTVDRREFLARGAREVGAARHRLDLRGTTYAEWFGWEWSFYLDIINVYNRKNILAENYRVNRQTLEIETRQTAMLPILPTIGISVKF